MSAPARRMRRAPAWEFQLVGIEMSRAASGIPHRAESAPVALNAAACSALP